MRGWGMLELLVALALMGLLLSWLAGFSPFFKSKLCKQEVEAARLFIESVRAEALSSGEDIDIRCGPGLSASNGKVFSSSRCSFSCTPFTLFSSGFIVPATTVRVSCSCGAALLKISIAGRIRVIWPGGP